MALSCFLKISSNVSRSQYLKTVTSQLLRSSSSLSSSHSQLFGPKKAIVGPSNLTSVLPVRHLVTSPKLSSADHKSHDHVTVWKLERVLSVALLPLIPAALASPCKELDTLVAILIVMHSHWGIEAIVVDYIRPILFGEMAPKIGMGLLYVFSIVTLAGLLNLIYNDVGLANGFLALWKAPVKEAPAPKKK